MISTKTRVMLWGRAAGRCSLPECRLALVLDETETDDPSLVGEACHIVAESEKGPRGISSLTLEERNKYKNLILMCNVHHKLIDDQPNRFTVEILHEMKTAHEQFVGTTFDAGTKRFLAENEVVAGYVDHWMKSCDLENWSTWTSWLFSSEGMLEKDLYESLKSLPEWLLARIWPPQRFLEIKGAMANFRHVVGGFLNTFARYSKPFPSREEVQDYRTERFYKIDEWDEERYNSLFIKYECHKSLVDDYVLELTRAANRICDCVRSELLSSFRLKEGALLVTSGPDMSLRFTTYRPEYQASDFPSLFDGEESFNLKRITRDVYFGTEREVKILNDEYVFRRKIFE